MPRSPLGSARRTILFGFFPPFRAGNSKATFPRKAFPFALRELFAVFFLVLISIRFAAFAPVSTELVAFWRPPNEADVRRIAWDVVWPATEESLEPRLKGVLHADRN